MCVFVCNKTKQLSSESFAKLAFQLQIIIKLTPQHKNLLKYKEEGGKSTGEL